VASVDYYKIYEKCTASTLKKSSTQCFDAVGQATEVLKILLQQISKQAVFNCKCQAARFLL